MACFEEKISKINLTADVEKVLKRAFLDDAEFIKNELKTGVAELFKVNNAFFVTRLEDKELVIVALAGSGLAAASTHIFKAAQKAGCQSIRFHTKRKGLARLLANYQPEYVETVYKIKV